jgi:hypothetical protein
MLFCFKVWTPSLHLYFLCLKWLPKLGAISVPEVLNAQESDVIILFHRPEFSCMLQLKKLAIHIDTIVFNISFQLSCLNHLRNFVNWRKQWKRCE